MKLQKIFLFTIGGASYVGLELLWRGRSHISMFLTGGSCFLLLGMIDNVKNLSLPFRIIAGASAITATELLAGLLVNRNYAVWDYRDMPLNFLGQICFGYSLLWLPASLAGMYLYRFLNSFCKKDPGAKKHRSQIKYPEN